VPGIRDDDDAPGVDRGLDRGGVVRDAVAPGPEVLDVDRLLRLVLQLAGRLREGVDLAEGRQGEGGEPMRRDTLRRTSGSVGAFLFI